MFRLQTLGGLLLVDATGAPVVTQRRRLALLALLAAAGERGMSRDKLVAFLWPESPADKARHALEQVVYSLRRQFLPQEPILGSDPIRLDRGLIESDLDEFHQAIARGALTEAVTLYRGPFLDGFFLSDAVAFEQWTGSERSRLEAEHERVLYRLAKEAGEEGRHTMEVDYWQRLFAVDPLSERTALGLARALALAGDWAGALRQAQGFDALVRRELALPPGPRVAAFVEWIRTERIRGPDQQAGTAGPSSTGGERYRIEREVGRGSVATVYQARDLKYDRLVALKLLRPQLVTSIEARRFLREIEILARLHHPHVLPLYDSGVMEAGGRGQVPYYAMPFVQGESLRERLVRVPQLSLEMALRIAREVGLALAYAHEQGVVHRDVKPGNILLEGEHAWVADFGIARALDVAGSAALSRSGVVLGTPAYMSPEQASGDEADGRSDQYSLGCVLYEMLAGEPPFVGRTSQIVVARHAADPVPPIRTLCPGVPSAVEQAIGRALAKTPRNRFPTILEFLQALQEPADRAP